MKYPDIIKLSKEALQIVSSIDKESLVVYLFLKRTFNQGRVDSDPLYQFVYRSFYRLDNAGLTSDFKSEYFKCLEHCRNSGEVDLHELTSTLYQFPNLKGQNSLQFSFVTKLANMIDNEYPIYDSEIAKVFKFRPPYYNMSFENRLAVFIGFYAKLKDYYSLLLQDDSCNEIFACFYKQFPRESRELPKVKLLDFFFWSTGKLQ